MCWYLTITVNSNFSETVKSAFTSAGFYLQSNGKSFFKHNFREDTVSFDITDGHCSCSIYSLLDANEETVNTKKLIKGFRKKGWSEDKIQQSIDERKAAAAARNKLQNENSVELRKLFADIFAQIGNFRLFAHRYRGSIEEENLGSLYHMELKITELLNKDTGIPEDVIVKIKK